MKHVITMVTRLLAVWALGIVLLAGSFSHAEGIEGHWLEENPSGSSVLYFFGSENAFYMMDGTSWVQGTYAIRADMTPIQLALHIKDGSDVEDLGKITRYNYQVDNSLLTLSTADHPTVLNEESSSGRYVFIGINLDSSEDDDEDGEFSIYASCFVGELTGNSYFAN